MTLRYALSELRRPAARRVFGRAWLWVCGAGALASVMVVGWDHAFFIAALWLVCVFAPARIAVEVLHSRGPRIRRDLQLALAGRQDRYATPEHVTLMAETLFAREVHLPRLAPPDLGGKVIEAASRLSDGALRSGGGPAGVIQAATICATLLQQWTGAVAAGESAGAIPEAPRRSTAGNGVAPPALWDPSASVQDQWVTLRAVAGLAALTITLTAVYEDCSGRAAEAGGAFRALAEAALDYVDQVGLLLDGPPWDGVEGAAQGGLSPERLSRLAETWLGFCAAPPPAPRRLRAFVEAVAG